MSDQIVRIRAGVGALLLAVAGLIWTFILPVTGNVGSYLQVHFLDVGQGDAVFIETPDGIQVLIDGGSGSSVLRELGKVMSFYDRDIDIVVATHPDADHIGGLVDVLKRYDVKTILLTENKSDSQVAANFLELVTAETGIVLYARRGQIFELGASTTLEILFPDVNPVTMESNASSIIMQLQYGDIGFMLTGDSPKGIEEYLVLLEGEHLESEVLKIGHHGSRTSTSELFLAEVQPRYGVVSAGADNRYGHPHTDVTDVLFNNRVETFSTADAGTVTFLSDGSDVWLK